MNLLRASHDDPERPTIGAPYPRSPRPSSELRVTAELRRADDKLRKVLLAPLTNRLGGRSNVVTGDFVDLLQVGAHEEILVLADVMN